MPSPRPSSTRIAATAAAAAALLTVATHSGVRAATLSEGFDTGLPAGWTVINLSSPVGTSSWFQGNGNPGGPVHYFDAYSGTPNSYVAAEFTAGAGAFADLSSWLITPTLGFNNCDRLSFFTRTYSNPAIWPDRLEVRFSKVGGTTADATATSVGDFTTLLLTVNAGLTTTGYPAVWTRYTAYISGLSGTTSGAVAFRYFMPEGGPTGANSFYIGIDSVSITPLSAPVSPPASPPVPEPATTLTMALGLAAVGLLRLRASRAGPPTL